jgi:phage terminase Nu1 subunit (DNA packaging protein)
MKNDETKKGLKPTEFLANYFGLTVRRVQQLASEGIFPYTKEKGIYYFDVPIVIKKYINYLQDCLQGRNKNTEEQEKQKLDVEIRFKEAKASMVELELNELKGKMHRAEDVEALFADVAATTKSLMMSLPGSLSIDICTKLGVDAKNAPIVSEIIEKDIFQILNELSEYEYSSEYFRAKVQEREGWTSDDISDE